MLNPVQTKREYFWLFLFVIVENAIALLVEVFEKTWFNFISYQQTCIVSGYQWRCHDKRRPLLLLGCQVSIKLLCQMLILLYGTFMPHLGFILQADLSAGCLGFLDCILQEVSGIQMTLFPAEINSTPRYHMTRDITTKPVCGTWLHYIPVMRFFIWRLHQILWFYLEFLWLRFGSAAKVILVSLRH